MRQTWRVKSGRVQSGVGGTQNALEPKAQVQAFIGVQPYYLLCLVSAKATSMLLKADYRYITLSPFTCDSQYLEIF
jgi:hypothetical protein